MIKKQSKQSEFEFVCLEQLVPQDHLLRKIDSIVDFEFIHHKVAHLYCPTNGRPGVDPVVLFKMLFIGYLFGIRSERQLIREIEMNMAYRWFLGYNLQDKIPHHSTISQNRRRRFQESNVYQEIFDEIVLLAMERKLVDGKHLYTDSTHLKANANKNKFDKQDVEKSTRDYLDVLNKDIAKDRAQNDKKPLKKKDSSPVIKETKISTTDPDSGYMVRDGKPKGFFYLDHRTVDGKFNIITDSFVTAGNVHDSIPYLKRLDHQLERFNFNVEAVGLDAGYFTAGICKGLVDRDIFGVISYRRPNHIKGYFRKSQFIYNSTDNSYTCPAEQVLPYRTTTREGFREYASNPKTCTNCSLRSQCTKSANHTKIVTRHIWEDQKECIKKNRLTPEGKILYKRRQETVERSFADSKQLHGHRYAKLRGIKKVQEQCLLAAACQNMKKIAIAS
ncbi:IS1182 family transposase [Lentisphaera marina]|uniref:IS1182 family transposase n=1 Tax=Lentisphaera marina TaxID=1111041 RepID=UPI0023672057|nr:IS1182 family transposase [Lentisphaera marina]MDD7983859.1 IS1182 family transposase [Lentisphaera marina]MDD7984597.1 IS1182 family transposase [Lentisphaera marina]MDD7986136.1 IS1182 family transposase [Lentisphaera marina]MDD7987393.1 IS1182 family transposase [Lentisphaera marina]